MTSALYREENYTIFCTWLACIYVTFFVTLEPPSSSVIKHPRGKTAFIRNSCASKHHARNKRTTAINPTKVVGTTSKNARN